MAALRSFLYIAIFYPGTVLWVLAALTASLLGTRRLRAVVLGWVGFHRELCRRLLDIRVEIEGEIPEGPHLIAVKHQSMFETLEMVRLAQAPVIVVKRELASIPLFGATMRRYGIIPVDRAAGPKALRELVTKGQQAVAAGRSVLIFPEGTRVMPGQTPPLRPGFAGLYRALGLAVVPVALDSGRLWGNGFVKRSGTMRFLVGTTIPSGLKRDEVESRVHAAINAFELAP